MGMEALGPSPRQSTLVKLKLSKRPKLSTSQWQPGWQFLTPLDWASASSERPSHSKRAIILWRENKFTIYINSPLNNTPACQVKNGSWAQLPSGETAPLTHHQIQPCMNYRTEYLDFRNLRSCEGFCIALRKRLHAFICAT